MESLCVQLGGLMNDSRIGTVHLSLYVALLQCREMQGGADPFFVRRREVMRLARIQGKTTYYKVMKELGAWGYVKYRPSNNAGGRSRVTVMLAIEGGLGNAFYT